jgi:hypothetical protein
LGYTVAPPAGSSAAVVTAYNNVLLMQSLLNFQKGQSFTNQTLASAAGGPRPSQSYHQPNNAIKLGYAWNIDSSTFLQAMAYHTDSVVYFDFPMAGGYSTATTSNNLDLLQGGRTSGGKIDLTKQLGDKNLLKTGAEYRYLTPVYDQVNPNIGIYNIDPLFNGNAELPDFIPAALCPAAYGGPAGGGCGRIYNVGGTFGNFTGVSSPQTVPSANESSQIHRNDWAYYIDDTWTPNDKLKVEGGLRIDQVNYQMPTPSIDPATCTSLYIPTYATNSDGTLQTTPSTNPNTQTTYINPVTHVASTTAKGTCPLATFPQFNNQTKKPIVPEPVFSATYRLGANDSIRSSWGRSVEFQNLALVDVSANPAFFGGPNGAFFNQPAYGIPGTTTGGVFLPKTYVATNCGALADQNCINYAEQLYWDNAQDLLGTPLQPVRPTVFTNFDFSWEHQFTRGFLNGVSFKFTPWYRKAQDAEANVRTVKVVGGIPLTDPITGALLFNPSVASNQGRSEADGVELQFTKEQTYGLSGQVSFTYQNERTSVIPVYSSEDFFPSIPVQSVLLGNIYRVGYLSPFVATFDFSYETHNGWRISPQTQWNVGYPVSPALVLGGFVNGQPYNIPFTNASATAVGVSGLNTDQFIDPMNPGSFFAPNVAATRGVPATSSPGGKLSHPTSLTNLTIEYNAPRTWSAGVQIFNLFGALYGGPSFNGRYQPVATGISGPLTGQNATGLAFPQYGMVGNYGDLRHGRNAYIDTPSGIRTYYLYLTVKL